MNARRHGLMKLIGMGVTCMMIGTTATSVQAQPQIRLTLIPPTPVTTQTTLDVRGAVRNTTDATQNYTFKFYLDQQTPDNLLHTVARAVPANSAAGVKFHLPLAGRAGTHRIILATSGGAETALTSQPLEIIESALRSTRRISGAWFEFYHWSENEGKPWNAASNQLTDDQWRELVRGMHGIGFDIGVIEDLFHNDPPHYVDQNSLTVEDFPGLPMYPSQLYPIRFGLAASDPLEAVLSEGDKLGMHFLVGIGIFAFFDFSENSLAWHKAVVDEVLDKYGHHPSFYGIYVPEEGPGSLGSDEAHRKQLIHFFTEFRAHLNAKAPDKVLLYALNCYHVRKGKEYYPQLLANLDIVCPFAFARMPADDWSGEEAMNFFKEQCDAAQCHLWMDLEAFVFGPGNALIPRPIEGIGSDLSRFTSFETTLCYAYTGLFNAPEQSVHLGGPATVKAYNDYKNFLINGPPKPLTYEHDAIGATYILANKPDGRYPGSMDGLTDGVIYKPDYQSFPWFGFLGKDMNITIDLGAGHLVKKIGVNVMQLTESGIYAPPQVEYRLSQDGSHWTTAGTSATRLTASDAGPDHETIELNKIDQKVRYIQVIAHNRGVIPPDHPSAGHPAWLFSDEVGVFFEQSQ
jgi:Domain of unknown function (DUF4434)